MNATVRTRVSTEQLLKAIREDCVTFFAFYLQDELTMDVPDLHQEIWAELLRYLRKARSVDYTIGVIKKLFCVPRGHSKSTLAKLAVILFLRYSPFSFGAYASNTLAVAVTAIKDIISWIESPNDIALYGDRPKKVKSNDTIGLYIFYVPTPEYGMKRCIMKALGHDTQVRGTLIQNKRPEFLIIDDVEDINTVNTEVTQARLDNWVLGSLLKALAKRALVIMLGNMISERSLLARLSKEPEWNPTVFGAIVRDKETGKLIPLWPGLNTIEMLIAEYKQYRRLTRGHVWACEMMNLTSEKVMGMDLDKLVAIGMPNRDMISAGCIVIDPAIETDKENDESALTVHVQIKDGYHGAGIPHVIDSLCGRFNEEDLLTRAIELSMLWGIRTWVIESIQAQKLFLPLFRNIMRIRQINPDTFLMLPMVHNQQTKSARITAFKRLVADGSYGIADGQDILLTKLMEYNPDSSKFDDLVDSASLGTMAWDMYGTTIESQGIQHVAMAVFGEELGQTYYSQLQISPM